MHDGCRFPGAAQVIAMAHAARALPRPVAGSAHSAASGAPQPLAAHYFALDAIESSPYCARRLARDFLESQGIRREAADSTLLVLSELVTNAITQQRKLGNPLVWISLRQFRGRLLIEVADSSFLPPVLRDAGPGDESGHGLMLVNKLSLEWGYFYSPDGRKVVYCIVEMSPARSEEVT